MQNSVKKPSDLRLVTLWGLVLLGYVLFVIEWFVIDFIRGSAASLLTEQTSAVPQYGGWFSSFFVADAGFIPGQATNWTITLLRAVGSILCGVMVVKFGYRHAVMIMMGLMCVCFPFLIIGSPLGGHNELTLLRPASSEVISKLTKISSSLQQGQLLGPVQVGSQTMLADGTPVSLIKGINGNEIGTSASMTGYAFFIIFRSTIAIGGTTLIAYAQPIIASLSSNRKKSILSNANFWGFNVGLVIVAAPFLIPGVGRFATANWVWVVTFMILLVFAMLLVFAWFEKKVDHMLPQKQSKTNQSLSVRPSALSILKRKTTWKLLAIAGVGTILLINPLTQTWFNSLLAISGAKKAIIPTARPILLILWVMGYLLGYFLLSPFNKTIYDKKRWLHFIFTADAVLVLLIVIFAATLGLNTVVGFTFVGIFTFIAGGFGWSLGSSILILPYEYKEYKRNEVSIIFGYVWGFAYVFYSIFDIITSVFLDAPRIATGNTSANILPGAIAAIVLFVSLLLVINWVIIYLPSSWIKNGDECVSEMTKKWRITQWQFVIANKAKNRYADLLK